jgi:hypothetical protein
MLEGKLMMRLVEYDKLTINQKYFIVHKLNFSAIEIWHREYVGIFQCYGVTNNILFNILKSYDHADLNEPHVGIKYWTPDTTIQIYEMIPQGQQSMENRAFSKIIRNIMDEHY